MFYVSGSNRIYYIDEYFKPKLVFEKPESSFGFFGIENIEDSVLVASREQFGFPILNWVMGKRKGIKSGSDVRLYEIDTNFESKASHKISNVSDVHQIKMHNDFLYLTDTAKNKISVFSTISNTVVADLLLGPRRIDKNHINAINVVKDKLCIGLNNKGKAEAAILTLEIKKLELNHGTKKKKIQIDTLIEVNSLEDVYHTHDLEFFDNTFWVCASHDGLLIRVDTMKPIKRLAPWLRGIAFNEHFYCLGLSELSDRSSRHKNLSGKVYIYEQGSDKFLKEINLEKVGQVNDIIAKG